MKETPENKQGPKPSDKQDEQKPPQTGKETPRKGKSPGTGFGAGTTERKG